MVLVGIAVDAAAGGDVVVNAVLAGEHQAVPRTFELEGVSQREAHAANVARALCAGSAATR